MTGGPQSTGEGEIDGLPGASAANRVACNLTFTTL